MFFELELLNLNCQADNEQANKAVNENMATLKNETCKSCPRKQELSPVLKSAIGPDQFAYKERCNTTLALLTCHHHWLKWLDRTTDFVRVFSFDFSKAFDSVPHAIVCNKLMSLNINTGNILMLSIGLSAFLVIGNRE